MARPREFDEGAVLDAAIRRFWLDGYEATSVRELAEEMGIAGASLYNAFGDKRSLYRSALERYLEQTFRQRVERLESGSAPAEAIRTFFHEILDRSAADKRKRGCMLVNATLENMPDDDDIRATATTFLREAEGFFLRCVSAGQDKGTITRSQAKKDLARMLLVQLLGIRVLARMNSDRATLKATLRPVFASLFDGIEEKPKRRLRRRSDES
jgi:TetR/AcrR family transcriptional regulator, transcriptional repressor for nem operon